VVEAVGEGVEDLIPGTRVAYGTAPLGTYAEAHIVPRARVAVLPDAISDTTAAGLMLKGLTAHYLLRQTYSVEAGATVLIHAAAGGVGLILCQWAKHLGARVIGTVGSAAKAEIARAHGCDHPLLYREVDVAKDVRALTEGRGVPVVYDSVGAATFANSLDCLEPRGLMVSYGNSSGPPPPIEVGQLAAKGSLYLTRPSLFHYVASQDALAAASRALFDVILSGAVKIEVGQTFPLRRAADAHRALEARQTVGSTVMTVDPA
jgi:NADPH2:quinone reductase